MTDQGTEAEYLSEWADERGVQMVGDEYRRKRPESRYSGGDRPQPNRWRCLVTGCNPRLNEATAQEHKAATGHRVARWPVRSAEGKRRARERNRTGYYDKYNVGEKSYEMRFGG